MQTLNYLIYDIKMVKKLPNVFKHITDIFGIALLSLLN